MTLMGPTDLEKDYRRPPDLSKMDDLQVYNDSVSRVVVLLLLLFNLFKFYTFKKNLQLLLPVSCNYPALFF